MGSNLELIQQTISDSDELYRRVHPNHKKENGQISSAAYKQRDPKLSVDLARLTTIEDTLKSHPNHGLLSILSRVPRSIGLTVYHSPLPDNYAHSTIEGKITDSKAHILINSSVLLRPPK